MTLKRIWQITQALVFTASVVLFLLIVGGYGLLVFFAHDANGYSKASPAAEHTLHPGQTSGAVVP